MSAPKPNLDIFAAHPPPEPDLSKPQRKRKIKQNNPLAQARMRGRVEANARRTTRDVRALAGGAQVTLPLRVVVPYRYEATIPFVAPMNTSAWRRHWSAAKRERDAWQVAMAFAFPTFARPRQPLARARVTITRITCAAKHPDPDNLAYASKPILDALVSIRVIADDGPEVERVWRWERGTKRGRKFTRVVVEEVV